MALRMKKNHASIGSDVIENILRTYPQLDVVWLLTGEGNMIKETHEDIPEFDQLPREQQLEINRIIELKIKERQQKELQELLKQVTEEIEKARRRS